MSAHKLKMLFKNSTPGEVVGLDGAIVWKRDPQARTRDFQLVKDMIDFYFVMKQHGGLY